MIYVYGAIMLLVFLGVLAWALGPSDNGRRQ